MLPNLTLIVAAYVVVRLVTFIVRSFPDGGGAVGRFGVPVLSGLALVLVVLCTLDTVGVGLSMGSSIEAHGTYEHGVHLPAERQPQ